MLIYRLLISILAPALAIALLLRVARRQEHLDAFGERMGLWRALPKGPVLWLHGASNGELNAARPLIEGLLAREPDATLLISCNSTTAKAMITDWGMPRIDARLAPLDLRWIYRRIMIRLDLRHFVLIEADFWPNRLITAQKADCKVSLVAGRMSEKSAKGWSRFSDLAARVFAGFDVISAQDAAAQARLVSLGARERAFTAPLHLKSLYQGACTPQAQKAPDVDRNAFWLAASTHESEDAPLLQAHLDARNSLPNLRMILAPRHPKRADEIIGLAQDMGLTVAQRSAGATLETPCDVFLADTLGEMEQWYRAASICFVAGSLAAKGGHTPFEPSFYNCAILHGPHLENFQSTYSELAAENGALLCTSCEEITNALIALQNPELLSRQCANAQRTLITSTQLDTVLCAILER